MTRTTPRRSRHLIVTIVAVAVLLGATAGAGTATALWRQSDQVAVTLRTGTVGFSAALNDAPATISTDGKPVTATLDSTQLAHVLDPNGLTASVTVSGFAMGHTGINYTLDVAHTGTWWDQANLTIWPVPTPTTGAPDCTTIPDTSTAPDSPVTLQAAGQYADAATAQSWCVHVVVPEKTGTYENTVTVKASSENGKSTDSSDSWNATVTQPRPTIATDDVLTLTFTPSITTEATK